MLVETSFGLWLKKRRKALDLTQQELAARVGCATVTIQKIEANKRRPSKQIAQLLAENLGIPADERAGFVKFARQSHEAQWPILHSQDVFRRAWYPSFHSLTNLPVQPGPLIGRKQDVHEVSKRIQDEHVRLLTLIGPPGVGKTRLAIQVSTELLDAFADGVYFVALASIGEPDQVPGAVAQTLGVNETATYPFAQRLKTYLRDKYMLLVLDNFEQVIAAASWIGDLLSECPWLSILATSRAPLNIRYERQFPVSPLCLPDLVNENLAPDELENFSERYSAITLFVERAQAIKPEFRITTENAGAIAEICARLDGLPLAIELVAARVKLLAPEMLRERLSGRMVLHTDGPRDVSQRHHTLYDAIDWSYALLKSEEQILLARLGVFFGGWTLDAADFIMADGMLQGSGHILDMIESLVNDNLVVQQEQGSEPRYSLLETIRTYSLERLEESGELCAVRQRHADYYLGLVKKASPLIRSADQLDWLDRLDKERGNLRAALAWFVEDVEDADAGLQLAGTLGWFWNIRSYISEGRSWLTKALQLGSRANPGMRAKALAIAGSLAFQQGDLKVGRTLSERSITIFREIGPPPDWEWDYALALTSFALVATYQVDYESVQSAANEAMALFQQLEDPWGVALALCLVGEAFLLQNDFENAVIRFENSLVLFKKIGDIWGAGIALLDLGYTRSLQGDLQVARAQLEESILLLSRAGERVMRSIALNILAQIVQQQGDYQRAAALYTESLDLFRKMGVEESVADVLYNLAELVQSHGHFQLAIKLYAECLDLFSQQANEQGIARCRARLAAITGVQGEVGSGD